MGAGANSINTNQGALISLQYLNLTNRELDQTQDRVSTGLKVIGAVDDASSFSIAQGIRADLKAYQAVSQGIANGKGVANIALAAATSISDLMGDIQKKITEGMNAANTTQQQNILYDDFVNLASQINKFINNATYSGRNLLSSGSTSVNVISNIDGSTVTLRAASSVFAASTLIGAQSLASTAQALQALTVINQARATIASVLGNLGADYRTIQFQDDFISKLTDATEAGLGSIVDADMARESARLQALQVKQQLGVQALNIANQRPQILQQLFQ
jgi:flagellin